jgi:hypothetical protein
MPSSNDRPDKKPYKTPKLSEFGDLRELTKTTPTHASHIDGNGQPNKTK